MQNTRIIYRNLWAAGTLLAASSEDPQFPKEYTQSDDTTLAWHSRNGTGSGNGVFVVSNSNHHIDFDEGGAELNAALTNGTYNGTTLAAEIKAKLDDAGALTYTVTYSESTGKFTIAATGNFTIRWQSGTNTANGAQDLLGFNDAADDTGAATYTGDYVRIHWPNEYLDCDLGAALEYDYISILGHNLSASATITLYGADDSAFTTNVVSDAVTYSGNNMRFYLAASRTKRYVRVYIQDPTNTSGYVKAGTIALGKYCDLSNQPAADGYEDGYEDFTEIDFSPSRNLHIVKDGPALKNRALQFVALTNTAQTYILDLLSYCGHHRAFEICFDYTSPNSYTWWANLIEAARTPQSHYNYWNWSIEIREHV